MAFVGADKFVGQTQRVVLLVDQKIKGVACKTGDTVDLTLQEARYLLGIKRVEFVAAEPKAKAAGSK